MDTDVHERYRTVLAWTVSLRANRLFLLVRTVILLASLLCVVSTKLAAQESNPRAQAADLNLLEAVDQWKAQLSFEPLTGTGHILRGPDLVRFKLGYPLFSIGAGKALEAPAIYEKPDGLYLPRLSFERLEKWFLDQEDDRASRFTVAAILIDPGHGGKIGRAHV